MCGGRAKKKYGEQAAQALGRSRGGFSPKIHGACDARGRPLDCVFSAGQAADGTYALPFIQDKGYEALLADKGYDTDAIVTHVVQHEAVCVIPPQKNRTVQRPYDIELYKARHHIECLFGFLKHYRRVFARFEKIAARFQAFLHFAATLQWLK